MDRRTKWMRYGIVVIFISGWMLAACAGKGNPPLDTLANVELTITRAQESNASLYAPLDLKKAQDKLDAAKMSIQREDYEKAKRYADEALLDARVAEAKARSEKAKKLTKEMQESVDSLEKEINRKQNQ